MMFLNMYWRSMWCAFVAQKIRTEISVQRKNQRRRFEVEVERSRDREVTVAKTYEKREESREVKEIEECEDGRAVKKSRDM